MSTVPEARRVAVVTGAAGGIGAAICRRLAADGFAVACVDLKEPDVAAPVKDLTGRELLTLLPLVLLCVGIGVRPQPLLDVSAGDIAVVNHIADGARARDGQPSLTPQPPLVVPPPANFR